MDMYADDDNSKAAKLSTDDWQAYFTQLLAKLQLDDAPAGGALVIYYQGSKVVHCHVGEARPEQAWTTDTLSLNFSMGKGVLATLVHVLASEGLLDYDVPIAQYWADFAQNGKDNITLAQVMSHQAGLFDITAVTTSAQDMTDWDAMVTKVAAMPTRVPEGAHTKSAYSALVYGWVLGGLVEKVTQLPLAQALKKYLTEPLGIADAVYFGIPNDKLDEVAQPLRRFAELMHPDSTASEIDGHGTDKAGAETPRRSRRKPTLKADSEATLAAYASLPNYDCWQQQAADTLAGNEHASMNEELRLDTAAINRLYFDPAVLNMKNYKAALVPNVKESFDYYTDEGLTAVIPAANGVAFS